MKFVKLVIAPAFVIATRPALALSVSGTDPVTGLQNLFPMFAALCGAGIVAIGFAKGGHAAANGHSAMPAVYGIIAGICIGFGTYFVMQRFGVNI